MKRAGTLGGRPGKRGSLLFLAAVYGHGMVLGAPVPTKDFWRERRSAAGRRDPPSADVLRDFPPLSSAVLGAGRFRAGGLPEELSRLILPFGEVREVHRSSRPGAPWVIHVQDLHGHQGAQERIAGLIEELHRGKGLSVVGVEGAWGRFALEPFRAYPHAGLTRAFAGYYLKEGMIGGAEAAGLSVDDPLLLWGVESRGLYEANVTALRRARLLKPWAAAVLSDLDASLGSLKARVYSGALKELDHARASHADARLTLAAYARVLSPSAGDFPQLSRFLKVAALEESLDFAAVTEGRRRLVEDLSRRLPAPALQALVERSAAHRAGVLPAGSYYAGLKALSARTGLAWASYAPFDRYVESASLADGIDREALAAELSAADLRREAALTRTPDQRRLAALSRLRDLLGKLLAHRMTSREWSAYQVARAEVLVLPASLAAFDGAASSAGLPEENLKPFEDFCRLALRRNDALAGNLLRRARDGSACVLVAGGFHTEGIVGFLKAKGASCAVVAPRIESVPSGPDYLEAFDRGPLSVGSFFGAASDSLIVERALGERPGPGAADRAAAIRWSFAVGHPAAEEFLRDRPEGRAARLARAAALSRRFPAVGRVLGRVKAAARGSGMLFSVEGAGGSSGARAFQVIAARPGDVARARRRWGVDGGREIPLSVEDRRVTLVLKQSGAHLPRVAPGNTRLFWNERFSWGAARGRGGELFRLLTHPLVPWLLGLGGAVLLSPFLWGGDSLPAAGEGLWHVWSAAAPFLGIGFLNGLRPSSDDTAHLWEEDVNSRLLPRVARLLAKRAGSLGPEEARGFRLSLASSLIDSMGRQDAHALAFGNLRRWKRDIPSIAARRIPWEFLDQSFSFLNFESPNDLTLEAIDRLERFLDVSGRVAARLEEFFPDTVFEFTMEDRVPPPGADIPLDRLALSWASRRGEISTVVHDRALPADSGGMERLLMLVALSGYLAAAGVSSEEMRRAGFGVRDLSLPPEEMLLRAAVLNGFPPAFPNAAAPRLYAEDGAARAVLPARSRRVSEDASFVRVLPGRLAAGGVFDGMGGHALGEAASRAVRAAARAVVDGMSGGETDRQILDALHLAHGRMSDSLSEDPRLRDANAGTTAVLSVAVPRGEGWRVFTLSAGDSRAYASFPAGRLEALTIDNWSLEGVLEPEKRRLFLAAGAQAPLSVVRSRRDLEEFDVQRKFEKRNYVYNVLVGGGAPSVPVISVDDVPAGTMLLLTSDGVHDNVTDPELESLARSFRHPADLAEAAGAAARTVAADVRRLRSKDDDLTALALRLGGGDVAPAPLFPSALRESAVRPLLPEAFSRPDLERVLRSLFPPSVDLGMDVFVDASFYAEVLRRTPGLPGSSRAFRASREAVRAFASHHDVDVHPSEGPSVGGSDIEGLWVRDVERGDVDPDVWVRGLSEQIELYGEGRLSFPRLLHSFALWHDLLRRLDGDPESFKRAVELEIPLLFRLAFASGDVPGADAGEVVRRADAVARAAYGASRREAAALFSAGDVYGSSLDEGRAILLDVSDVSHPVHGMAVRHSLWALFRALEGRTGASVFLFARDMDRSTRAAVQRVVDLKGKAAYVSGKELAARDPAVFLPDGRISAGTVRSRLVGEAALRLFVASEEDWHIDEREKASGLLRLLTFVPGGLVRLSQDAVREMERLLFLTVQA